MNVEAEVTGEEVNGENRILVVEYRTKENGKVIQNETKMVQVPFHSTSEDIRSMLKSRVEEKKLRKVMNERQDEFEQAREDPVGLCASDDNIAQDVCDQMLNCHLKTHKTSLEKAKESARENNQ